MRTLAIAASIFLLAGPVLAGTPVDWLELIDQSAQTYEDPYRDLSYDHLEAVALVASARDQLSDGTLDAETRSQVEARLSRAQATLDAAGLDADWLIDQRWVVAEQRERAASAGNPAFDQTNVTLAGYAIPAPPDADGTPAAYLVPERGMCSHMPPPHPNQMIRLRMPSDWAPRMMHEPLQVTGLLTIAPTKHQVMVVDGMVPMWATFALQVEEFTTLGRGQATVAPGSNASPQWMAGIIAQMRANTTTGPDGN